MPFSKSQKTSAYFSRFQTKLKRRREGKTDYYQRKRLVTQAKNKYNAPKYRLVVRFTNRDIICQVAYSKVEGDVIFASAYAHELPKYGITHGLTNWAAAYATGLLVARRALKKLGLDKTYTGIEEANGEFDLTEAIGDGPRPFKVFLDIGLRRTSTGSRVFGAMKGASDGGLYIPHNAKRFPGYDIESEELDSEVLRKYIFGGHVGEYMEMLLDEDEERYKNQFSGLIRDEIDADGLEEIYANAHKEIRENPDKEVKTRDIEKYKEISRKYRNEKLSYKERKQRVAEKIEELKSEPNRGIL